MTRPTLCPRCHGQIPNNEHPGAYRGALSRFDNTTEICSACGTEEALLDFQGDVLSGPDQWPEMTFHAVARAVGPPT